MAEKLNYATLINTVIDRFDSIYKALESKSVEKDGSVISTPIGLDVSEYAGLISSQLFRVSGVTSANDVVHTNGVIAKYVGTSDAPIQASAGSTLNNASGVVTLTLTNAGYYTAGSVINSSALEIENLSLTGVPTANANIADNDTSYVLSPTAGKLLGNVTVSKGSATVNMTSANLENNLTTSAQVEIISESSTADLASLEAIAGGYVINLKNTSQYSGTIKAINNLTLEPGYITAPTITSGEYEFTAAEGANGQSVSTAQSIYLPKATITGLSGSGAADLTVAAGMVTIAEGQATEDNSYKLTASGTFQINSGSATITEGYIKQSDGISVDADGSGITSKDVYIKKGSVKTKEDNIVGVELQAGDIAASGDAYNIAVSLKGSTEGNIAIENGYIEASAVPYKLSGGELNIPVGKGKATVNLSAATVSKDAASDTIFKTANSGDDYELIVNPSVSLASKTPTEGYIKDAADIEVSLGTNTPSSFFVTRGKAEYSTSLSATAHDASDDLDHVSTDDKGEVINLFVDSVPVGTDYYEVKADAIIDFAAGYIANATNLTPDGVSKYIPKATFKYVTDSDSGNYLEVATGGYVPSGLIRDIADIETGTPDFAEVAVTLTSDILSTSGNADDYYQIAISKGTINSGYISSSEGTLTGSNSYYVRKGKATVSNSLGEITVNPTATPVTNGDGAVTGYSFSGTGKATAQMNLTTTGYLTTADISGGTLEGNIVSVEAENTATLTLNKAQLSVGSTKVTLKDANHTGVVSSTETNHYIDLALDSNKILATVATAGYLSETDNQELTVSADPKRVYIKEGAKLENIANSATDNNTTLNGTVQADNSYKVSLDSYNIAVAGTLGEGYYSGENLAVSGQATVSAKETTISAAAASVSVAGGIAIDETTSELTWYSGTEDGFTVGNYYEVSPKSTGLTITPSVGTKGYLNVADQISTNGGVTPTKSYIAKYVATGEASAVAPDQQVFAVTVGANSPEGTVESRTTTVATAQKYVANNIEVRLHDDAMGANVHANLSKLENRLAGLMTNLSGY